MLIKKEMKMVDVIHLNYLLLPVINRFGITLGFGDVSVEELCLKKNINLAFFLNIINAYHDESFFPKTDLQKFSVKLIVDYLQKAHKNYLHDSVPQIEKLIQNLVVENSYKKQNLEILQSFFNEYKNEITEHINREESKVYPYAVQVENAYETNNYNNALIKKMENYSMQYYLNEHDNIEEKLFDLKNIIIKYLPPPKNTKISNSILIQLFNLEKDLNDHSRIEEKVMIPKVVKMEKSILNYLAKNK
ncbi:MAG: hypothetical protein GXO79_15915 [Chlorobi bacterium]|nr:hypothetical protein [Chlorobiota bacterium]